MRATNARWRAFPDKGPGARAFCFAAGSFCSTSPRTTGGCHANNAATARTEGAGPGPGRGAVRGRGFPADPEGYWAYSLIYAVRKDVKQSFDYMQKALESGLPLSRFTAGLSPLFDPLTHSSIFQVFIKDKEHLLVHGPVLGNITEQSVSIWIRTYNPQKISIIATNLENENKKYTSEMVTTHQDKENTAVVNLSGLEAGTKYSYEIASS